MDDLTGSPTERLAKFGQRTRGRMQRGSNVS